MINAFDVAIAPFISRRNSAIGLSALKLRDYAAAGRAVVAADLPGIADHAEAGWLVLHRPDDPQDLADKVEALLADPVRRKEMGDTARRYAEANFGWTRTAGTILEHIGACSVRGSGRDAP